MKTLNKVMLTIAVFLAGCSTARLPQNNADFAKTSAMITLENKRSGGSGVIIKSLPNMSWVLTNKHVCQLIQNGGLVTTDQGSYPVYSFQVYSRHDLCLIKVLANLHQNNRLAERSPELYSGVVIAGHPALLPTIITRGHFTSHMIIQLMIDTKKCDGSETGDDSFMCALTGQKPVVQSYEAQPVTATIMAGSSGSGVFNNRGEISGLVFAGSEGLSYGFIVPYEYVKDFLLHSNQYMEQYPDPQAKPRSFFTSELFQIQSICKTHPENCKGISFPGIYHVK